MTYIRLPLLTITQLGSIITITLYYDNIRATQTYNRLKFHDTAH